MSTARVWGGIFNINLLTRVSLIVAPLVSFTAILLGLVFWHWNEEKAGIEGLNLDTSFTSNSLYVDYSATRLILVASWSSSVALPLIGSLLILTSYPVAADMIWSSQNGFHMLLPTPSQLAILTDLLDAKQIAILTWLRSVWRRDGRRVPSRWVIEFPAILQLAALSLSVSIIAADTWLHIATKSITISFLATIPHEDRESMGATYYHSRVLNDDCASGAGETCLAHQIYQGQGKTSTHYAADIKELVTDTSFNTRINTTAGQGFFLAPRLPQPGSSVMGSSVAYQEFQAKTFAISANCWWGDCTNSTATSTPGTVNFHCEQGMEGQVNSTSWISIALWSQANNTDYRSDDYVEVGVVMLLESTTIVGTSMNRSGSPTDDANGLADASLVSARCQLNPRAVSYEWTNSTGAPNMTDLHGGPSRSTLIDIVCAPIVAGYFSGDNFGLTQKVIFREMFQDKAGLSQNPEDPKNKTNINSALSSVGTAISFFGLGLFGGTFEPWPAEQLRLSNSTIITQVGKAPLFTLVILNLWYASFGILLFFLAAYILRDPETSKDILEVQELISVHGLATAAVKRHRHQLDSADLRVGVEQVDGVWQFCVFEIKGPSDESKSLLGDDDEVDIPQV